MCPATSGVVSLSRLRRLLSQVNHMEHVINAGEREILLKVE